MFLVLVNMTIYTKCLVLKLQWELNLTLLQMIKMSLDLETIKLLIKRLINVLQLSRWEQDILMVKMSKLYQDLVPTTLKIIKNQELKLELLWEIIKRWNKMYQAQVVILETFDLSQQVLITLLVQDKKAFLINFN